MFVCQASNEVGKSLSSETCGKENKRREKIVTKSLSQIKQGKIEILTLGIYIIFQNSFRTKESDISPNQYNKNNLKLKKHSLI